MTNKSNLKQWHKRPGYVAFWNLCQIFSIFKTHVDENMHKYEVRPFVRQTRLVFPSTSTFGVKAFDLVHMDI